MDIAIVGTPEFTLGFQLAGIDSLFNPEGEEEMISVFKSLLNSKSVGIVVVDSYSLANCVSQGGVFFRTDTKNGRRDGCRELVTKTLWQR